LLDVGCGSGYFLSSASKAGWEVVGVEPSKAHCEKAKELLNARGDLICATLEDASLPASYYDVLTLWDVLEHVPDPVNFISTCCSLLKPGGFLFVNVPDLDSLQSRVLGSRWPLLLPEHLNYFNRKSLGFCGESAKLTRLYLGKRLASFTIEYVLYRLSQHHIPGAALVRQLANRCGINNIILPFPLGEIFVVWQR
jgi:SAM-dependent methyltransferase